MYQLFFLREKPREAYKKVGIYERDKLDRWQMATVVLSKILLIVTLFNMSGFIGAVVKDFHS